MSGAQAFINVFKRAKEMDPFFDYRVEEETRRYEGSSRVSHYESGIPIILTDWMRYSCSTITATNGTSNELVVRIFQNRLEAPYHLSMDLSCEETARMQQLNSSAKEVLSRAISLKWLQPVPNASQLREEFDRRAQKRALENAFINYCSAHDSFGG